MREGERKRGARGRQRKGEGEKGKEKSDRSPVIHARRATHTRRANTRSRREPASSRIPVAFLRLAKPTLARRKLRNASAYLHVEDFPCLRNRSTRFFSGSTVSEHFDSGNSRIIGGEHSDLAISMNRSSMGALMV